MRFLQSLKRPVAALFAPVFLCIALFGPPVLREASSGAAQDTTYVRVLLSTKGASSMSCPVSGSYTVAEAQRSFTGGRLSLKASGDNVILSHSEEGELYSGTRVTIERNDPGRDGGTITMKVASGTRQFLGGFTVTASGGALQVVNRVPLSHYLYGVVAYEMSNTFPTEALKAQAVAAKGYALLHMGGGSYDIGDTAEDQVYKGYVPAYTNVIAAVDETMGQVLSYNGKTLQCYYAASNGGWMIPPSVRWSSGEFDGAYATGADLYDMKNAFTPNETVFLPYNYSEREMGTRAFAFLDSRIMAIVSAPGFLPEGFHFGAVQSIDSVVSSGQTGYKGDKNYTDVTLTATVRADKNGDLIPTPTPAWPATPSPTPENPAAPSPTPPHITPGPTEIPVPPQPGEPGYDTYVPPTPTPAQITPDPTPEWTTPSPTPENQPTPSPTPMVELTRELPVTVRFSFQDLFTAGLFRLDYLKITYAEEGPGGFYLRHARYGHGVGMSQRGAEQMGYEGRTYQEILRYYYPGAALTPLTYTFPETLPGATGTVSPSAAASAAVGGATATTESGADAGAATASGSIASAPSTGVITGAKKVNLRSRASTGSSSLEKLDEGAQLSLLGMQGDWYYVTAPSGNTGFVRYDYVSITGGSVIAAGKVDASAVNYRTGPGTDFPSLGRLSRDTEVGIYGLENGWYKIRAASTGQDGYVSKSYIVMTKTVADGVSAQVSTPAPTDTPAGMTATPIVIGMVTPTPSPTPAPTATPMALYAAAGYVNAGKVNLRAGASTRTESYGKLEKNTPLSLYEKLGSWYRVYVKSTGQEGFIYAKYVSLETANDVTGKTVSVSKGYINASGVALRSGAGTQFDSLGRLTRNTTVKILGSQGSWYNVEVRASGTEGYVFAKYVALTGTVKQDTSIGTITARLNLRTAATTGPGSRVLTVMPRGAVVTVHSEANGWCYVTYNGASGYCIASCVRIG